MKLKCRINEKDYDLNLMQGASFTDNLNETLDSGIICIDQVPEIKDLKPYDDVYIWDASERFDGFSNVGDEADFSEEVQIENKTIEITSIENYEDISIEGIDTFNKKSFLKYDGINSEGYFTLKGMLIDILIDDLLSKKDNENSIFKLENLKIIIPFLPNISGPSAVPQDVEFTLNKKTKIENAEAGQETTVFTLKNEENGIEWECYFNEELSLCVKVEETFYSINNQPSKPQFKETKISESTSFKLKTNVKKEITIKLPQEVLVNEFNIYNKSILEVNYKGSWFDIGVKSFRKRDDGKYYLGYGDFKIDEEFDEIIFDENGEYKLVNLDHNDWRRYVQDIRIRHFYFILSSPGELPQIFYKHMLVDSFQRTRLNLGNSEKDGRILYKYNISLFSEIKKLEKIILPNSTITQSLIPGERRTCWEYLQNFITLYSPKYKVVENVDTKEWAYIQKYRLSEKKNEYLENGKTQYVTNLKEVFDNTTCPEMSWTAPSLRDVLNQIFSIKDLIPVVFNDVIYGLNIGALDEELPTFDRNGVNFDVSSMSSSDYATDARREYSGALSQEGSAHMIEYMGFRSPNSPFLNLSTMQLETRFPIYKINSIKMCYYKEYTLEERTEYGGTTGEPIKRTFLCKHNITPLVLQNSVRNSLNQNPEKLETYYGDINDESDDMDYSALLKEWKNEDNSVEAKLKYIASLSKLCTVGYDIGSNVISGWGTTYEYIDYLWFKSSYSYLENIVRLLDIIETTGTDLFQSVLEKNAGKQYKVVQTSGGGIGGIIPLTSLREDPEDEEVYTNKLKSIFFEVDYDALYSGAVVHNKDYIEDDDITTVDNCSTSLAVLETDGLFEKEKLNRMSNKQFKFTARYDDDNGGALYKKIQNVGSIDRTQTNSIIYSREYQIYDNCILANYSAVENYILKNYFTSVWAKYRTYSYMSYGESVKRTENRRQLVLLSTDKQYYEYIPSIQTNQNGFISDLFNFFVPSDIDEFNTKTNLSQINCGFFEIGSKRYLSDINSFATGNAICFNISMYDNISGGTFLDSLSSGIKIGKGFLSGLSQDKANKLVGDYTATQGWYVMPNSASDAFIDGIGFYFAHLDNEDYFGDIISSKGLSKVEEGARIMQLPLLNYDVEFTHKIGEKYPVYKDNKERIDFTYQFNYLSADKEKIILSPWATKLNDLVGNYNKYKEHDVKFFKTSDASGCTVILSQEGQSPTLGDIISAGFGIKPADSILDNLNKQIMIFLTKDDYNKMKDALGTKGEMCNFSSTNFSECFSLNGVKEGKQLSIGTGVTGFLLGALANLWVTNEFKINRRLLRLKRITMDSQKQLHLILSTEFNMRHIYDVKYNITFYVDTWKSGEAISSTFISNDIDITLTTKELKDSENETKYYMLYGTIGWKNFIVWDGKSIPSPELNVGGLNIANGQFFGINPGYVFAASGFVATPDNINTAEDAEKVMEIETIIGHPETKKFKVDGNIAFGNYDITPVQTNMIVVKSTEKLSSELIYQDFTSTIIDKDKGILEVAGMPDFLLLDTIGYRKKKIKKENEDEDEDENENEYEDEIVEGHTVDEIFKVNTNNLYIEVKGSVFEEEIKSVQYYFRDNNGTLHFVFGVNLDKDKNGKNKDMKIYISCIEKRSMKVYDKKHRVIGYSKNYVGYKGIGAYGTGQYYTEIDSSEGED